MSAQLVQSSMKELKSINTEIKRLNLEVRNLKAKKKELEETISHFLETHNQPGIKYGTMTIVTEEKKVRQRKKVEERTQEITEILENHGVPHIEKAIKEINEAMKGKKELVTKLKVKEHV
jgi:hypothetical protein